MGPQDFLPGDGMARFWVPIHKLFSGRDCIQGLEDALEVSFELKHVNEKIRKVHRAVKSKGWTAAQTKKPPFVITEELANFDPRRGMMVPFVHDPLVSPAKTDDGRLVGFRVKRDRNLGESALWLESATSAREWPEFVHIRHKIDEDENGKQEITYLPNTTAGNIRDVLKTGGFDAANFVDWTADGYLKANCPRLGDVLNGDSQTRSLAAYSILAQPDFFPLVTQRDLTAWWKKFPLKQFVWSDKEGILPGALSGSRLPANITLRGANFESSDTTMTAIVGTRWPDQRRRGPRKVKNALDNRPKRQSTLSYRASSLFDPGWDISEASLNPLLAKAPAFMANYGLGSPFPEDTLICSAFGAFWPGAAPDITRFFPPGPYPITTPLTDSEACWRAIDRPEKTSEHTIEFQTLAYADFVKAIYDRKFDFARFAKVSFSDFVLRTAVTARFYKYLHKVDGVDAANSKRRAKYVITSFRVAEISEVKALNNWTVPREETFRIEFGKGITPEGIGPDPRIKTIKVKALRVIFVGGSQVAEENTPASGKWRVLSLRRRRST